VARLALSAQPSEGAHTDPPRWLRFSRYTAGSSLFIYKGPLGVQAITQERPLNHG
jgi:hypothetical protein